MRNVIRCGVLSVLALGLGGWIGRKDQGGNIDLPRLMAPGSSRSMDLHRRHWARAVGARTAEVGPAPLVKAEGGHYRVLVSGPRQESSLGRAWPLPSLTAARSGAGARDDALRQNKVASERMTQFQSKPDLAGMVSDPMTTGPAKDRDGARLGPSWIPYGWALGEKRVLIFRVDFPDAPSDVAGDDLLAAAGAAVDRYYRDVSGGRSSFSFVTLPGVLRVSRPRAEYTPSFHYALAQEALPVARAFDQANGATGRYDPDQYERWVLLFADVPGVSNGVADIGEGGAWVDPVTSGAAFSAVLAHELGHNNGFFHSHAWLPAGASPVGPGQHIEYGDRYDLMGSGSVPMGHLNAPQKAAAGYLEESAILRVAQTGTYRLYRHDHAAADGVRALVLAPPGDFDFWLEHRRELTGIGDHPDLVARFQRGVFVHWNKHPPMPISEFVSADAGPYLLDMTPGSPFEFSDAALAIGETFTHPTAGFSISPFATGGESPREYIDVRIEITPSRAPVFTQQPAHQAVAVGSSITLAARTVSAPPPDFQWQRNGQVLAGETAGDLLRPSLQPDGVGLYQATLANAEGTTTSSAAIVGIASTSKVTGAGREVGADIAHPNGNVYDQVLLEGTAAAITANPGQIVRMSFVDLSDDIVQVEFAGAGTLSLTLDSASGPAPAAKYNQPDIAYWRGHASIVVVGANETTHLTVFSVGRATAINQTLFREGVDYDGVADIAFVAILSSDGRFGGLHTGNAHYWSTHGPVGVYAPGVQFSGAAAIGDIVAAETGTPVLLLGGAGDVAITGGGLGQWNARAVQVSGLTQLKFTAGSTSHGTSLPRQNNRARLVEGDVDITARLIVYPE